MCVLGISTMFLGFAGAGDPKQNPYAGAPPAAAV